MITWPILPPHGGRPVQEESLSAYTAAQREGQALVEAAKGWPADLMVLGTHGWRGLHHLVLGSVAEGVVRLAPVPVLLVRRP